MSSSASENNTSNFDDSRAAAEQIALQLALLQQQSGGPHETNGHGGHHAHNAAPIQAQDLLNGHGASGSLEDLKNTQRRSQNMTECVPVPSSEHVAEIVGRQGCKIKALRAKTNTYIKTPVRGEEPVFVVTGRKEDVALAKREILSAADHFSQIRASRKSNINSTLAFGQLMANTPGQTTVQVRVPYRVVGLVVGPKGATIKRIQQQTHTYIVTPSRDKEPVFEVTGLPENVEAARKEIEAHIAIRTGSSDFGGSNGGSNGLNGFFNLNDNGSNGDSANDLFSAPSGGLNSPFSASSGNLDHSILNNETNGFFKSNSGMTLANLLDSSNNFGDLSRNVAWSNGTDSHDSGIGHSPPFDSGLHQGSGTNGHVGGGAGPSSNYKNFLPSSSSSNNETNTLTSGIWGELNKVLGGLDLNGGNSINHHNKQFLSIGSRSSLDLGTLGRPTLTSEVTSTTTSTLSSSNMLQNTANGIGRQMSLPTDHNNTLPGYNGILSSSSSSNQDTNSETKDEALAISKEILAANE